MPRKTKGPSAQVRRSRRNLGLCEECGGALIQSSERYRVCKTGLHGKLVPVLEADREAAKKEEAAFFKRVDEAVKR